MPFHTRLYIKVFALAVPACFHGFLVTELEQFQRIEFVRVALDNSHFAPAVVSHAGLVRTGLRAADLEARLVVGPHILLWIVVTPGTTDRFVNARLSGSAAISRAGNREEQNQQHRVNTASK